MESWHAVKLDVDKSKVQAGLLDVLWLLVICTGDFDVGYDYAWSVAIAV